MKVKWYGGPLDGLEDEGDRFGNVWSSPDPQAPQERVVIYLLARCPRPLCQKPEHAHGLYAYNQRMTDAANQRSQQGG